MFFCEYRLFEIAQVKLVKKFRLGIHKVNYITNQFIKNDTNINRIFGYRGLFIRAKITKIFSKIIEIKFKK